uniref:NADH-ubiquinone oxidoreductase chain 1 n=1 Tax=Speleketor irwini TaxID=342007 RepID=A0A343QCI6_9NEOP|nr:NADH dehydrogenase subunit 1 [Speleketor irwini]ATU07133.1 NADH dehydrogenase subunit 1 [Speleketor irwini]
MYMYDLFLVFFSYLILVIMVLVSVAFLTLLERSVLGYIQIRKGPNKVGLIGILQPFSDAVKLFSKEQVFPYKSNYLIYYLCPGFSFLISLFIWGLMPYSWGLYNYQYGFLFFMVCISLGVYGLMIIGWSSNSMYSLLGGLRGVAQTISYEVSFAFILLSIMIVCGGYSLISLSCYQEKVWFFIILFPLCLMMWVSMMAEGNRTPFDFAEGESELVSGFNVEYGSGGFALIFLSEYSMILFMSMFFVVIFLGGDIFGLSFILKFLFIVFLFLWVRGSLPRFRYDKLMNLCWMIFLFSSLSLLVFYGLLMMSIIMIV